MTSFAALSLADELNRAIKDSGYEKPTPIQQQMIPIISGGSDVIGLSQTGTGKTAAFVLPMLDKLATSKTRARRGSCSVLVLSPTRELSNQIADTVRRYGKYVDYNQTIIVGGVSYPPQIRALQRGTDIVIATPGRVLDHIESGVMSLDETTVIVLDEADQMLDFGFLPVIKRILSTVPEDRQMVLLSATMPKAVQELTKEFMRNPEFVEATPESRPVDKINQQVIYMEKPRKNMALLEILSQKEAERSIVFVRTKFGADRVQRFLNNYGILAVSLHGNKSQGQRQRALGQFRSGEATVLVATDIAGRGIDIDDVSHVINVDLPNIPESYVHRIGRTARAGRNGIAISFCSKSERSFLRDIERLIGSKLPKREDKPGSMPTAALLDEPVNLDKAPSQGRGGRGNDGGGRSRRSRDGDDRGGRSRGPKKPFKKSFSNDDRGDRSERPSRGDRKTFKKSFDDRGDRQERSDRKPFKKSFDDRGDRQERSDRKPFKKSYDDRGDRQERSDRKPFKKSFDDRGDRQERSERKPFKKSFDDRGDRQDRPNRGERKPFKKSHSNDDRGGKSDRPARHDREERSDRKPFKKSGSKPFGRSGGKTFSKGKPAGKSGPKTSGKRNFQGAAEQGLKRKSR